METGEVMHVSQFGGFWARFAALLLDGILIGIVVMLAISIANLDTTSQAVQLGEGLFTLAYAVVLPGIWYGYTVGKRILGVRVVKTDNKDVHIGTMLLREFVGGVIYAFTLGIALVVSIFMVALRRDKRAIHDFIAGTYVTYQKPQK